MAPPPHVVNQYGGGIRVRTEVAGSSVVLNWRAGDFDFGRLGKLLPGGAPYYVER